jgi:crotonobetaine/carnitine-CoA ligase
VRTYNDYQPTFADRGDWTLNEVLTTRARTHGEKVYLDVPGTGYTLTYAQTLDLGTRIASGLLQRGHEPGDRLVIMMPNCAEYILGWIGSGLAGMAQVPINTAYRGTFFEHQLRTVSATGAVITPEFAERFLESREACEAVRHVYIVGTGADVDAALSALNEAGYSAERFDALGESPAGELPTLRPQDLAAIFFTSGTTGLSKGVAMSHAQYFFFADEGRALVRLTDQDVYLSVGPLFHGNAQFLAAYPAMIAGARFVLHEKFSATRWTSWIRESGATVTNLVGVMSDFLWKQPARDDDADNKLRCVWAVPNHSDSEGFKKRFGIEELVENFGLTEISMPVLTPYGVPRPKGAAGLGVTDWYDIQLIDPETDEEVPVGEVGELVVRPKVPWTICSGYFGMPERTAEALRNCWFHTGDGLRRDEEGWYYFVDRLKDAIRRRGENISSFEVEQAILADPRALECAVVAVPADGAAAEDEVMAVVVLESGQQWDPSDFWAHCERSMPYFAVPRYVRFVSELPKTPSGKIRKAVLREATHEGTVDRTTFTAAAQRE